MLWTAGLPLFGFVGFALYSAIFVFPMGPHAYGPGVNIGWPPRFAFFTYMLWVISVASQAIRCSCTAIPAATLHGLADYDHEHSTLRA